MRHLFSSILGIILFFIFASNPAQAQKNMTLIGQLPYPGQTIAGVWQYVDDFGTEYALVGTAAGVSIVSLANPANPVEVFAVATANSLWKELRTWNKHAYVVTEGGGGMTIIDLSNLPASINSVVWTGNGAIAGLVDRGHAIGAYDGYIYIFGANIANKGALILRPDDPMNPTYVGMYNQNYIHDGYVRNDTLWAGEIYQGQFSVISLQDKTAPVVLATQATPLQFNHNTWLNDAGSVLFTTDEKSNAPVGAYDVSNVNNIVELDLYKTINNPTQEVHNVRVLNDYLVNACYGSQVTIVDASRPDNMIEVGHYPTGTWLCWDASPYLPSGKIIATDSNNGLFVFDPFYVRGCYLEGNVKDSLTNLPLSGVQVAITGYPVLKNSKSNGEYRTGIADAGSYDVTFSKNGYTSRTITNIAVNNGQVTILNVKLLPINVGINETLNDVVTIVPNPFDNSSMITLPTDFGDQINGSFILRDITGRNVIEKSKFLGRTINIDGIQLPAGSYLYEIIISGKAPIYGKLIKK